MTHNLRDDKHPDEWVYWDELSELDADTLRRLQPWLSHYDRDGKPYLERSRLDELLQRFEIGDNRP